VEGSTVRCRLVQRTSRAETLLKTQTEALRWRHRRDHERVSVRHVLPDPQGDQARRVHDVNRQRQALLSGPLPSSGAMKAPAGLLLAAGAGRRMGTSKALVGNWLVRGIEVLVASGCSPVVVVRGAAVAEARELLQGRAVVIASAADWSDGLSASLRSGIAALPAGPPSIAQPAEGSPRPATPVKVAYVGDRAPAHGGEASRGVSYNASDDDGGGTRARCASSSKGYLLTGPRMRPIRHKRAAFATVCG
jgi:hypothetical protein